MVRTPLLILILKFQALAVTFTALASTNGFVLPLEQECFTSKKKIAEVWPLLAAPEAQDDNIRKFENIGTRSFAIEQAISSAIDFHLAIGSEKKQARLNYLKEYWVDQVKSVDKVRFYSSQNPQHTCALFNFGIEGMDGTCS